MSEMQKKFAAVAMWKNKHAETMYTERSDTGPANPLKFNNTYFKFGLEDGLAEHERREVYANIDLKMHDDESNIFRSMVFMKYKVPVGISDEAKVAFDRMLLASCAQTAIMNAGPDFTDRVKSEEEKVEAHNTLCNILAYLISQAQNQPYEHFEPKVIEQLNKHLDLHQ